MKLYYLFGLVFILIVGIAHADCGKKEDLGKCVTDGKVDPSTLNNDDLEKILASDWQLIKNKQVMATVTDRMQKDPNALGDATKGIWFDQKGILYRGAHIKSFANNRLELAKAVIEDISNIDLLDGAIITADGRVILQGSDANSLDEGVSVLVEGAIKKGKGIKVDGSVIVVAQKGHSYDIEASDEVVLDSSFNLNTLKASDDSKSTQVEIDPLKGFLRIRNRGTSIEIVGDHSIKTPRLSTRVIAQEGFTGEVKHTLFDLSLSEFTAGTEVTILDQMFKEYSFRFEGTTQIASGSSCTSTECIQINPNKLSIATSHNLYALVRDSVPLLTEVRVDGVTKNTVTVERKLNGALGSYQNVEDPGILVAKISGPGKVEYKHKKGTLTFLDDELLAKGKLPGSTSLAIIGSTLEGHDNAIIGTFPDGFRYKVSRKPVGSTTESDPDDFEAPLRLSPHDGDVFNTDAAKADADTGSKADAKGDAKAAARDDKAPAKVDEVATATDDAGAAKVRPAVVDTNKDYIDSRIAGSSLIKDGKLITGDGEKDLSETTFQQVINAYWDKAAKDLDADYGSRYVNLRVAAAAEALMKKDGILIEDLINDRGARTGTVANDFKGIVIQNEDGEVRKLPVGTTVESTTGNVFEVKEAGDGTFEFVQTSDVTPESNEDYKEVTQGDRDFLFKEDYYKDERFAVTLPPEPEPKAVARTKGIGGDVATQPYEAIPESIRKNYNVDADFNKEETTVKYFEGYDNVEYAYELSDGTYIEKLNDGNWLVTTGEFNKKITYDLNGKVVSDTGADPPTHTLIPKSIRDLYGVDSDRAKTSGQVGGFEPLGSADDKFVAFALSDGTYIEKQGNSWLVKTKDKELTYTSNGILALDGGVTPRSVDVLPKSILDTYDVAADFASKGSPDNKYEFINSHGDPDSKALYAYSLTDGTFIERLKDGNWLVTTGEFNKKITYDRDGKVISDTGADPPTHTLIPKSIRDLYGVDEDRAKTSGQVGGFEPLGSADDKFVAFVLSDDKAYIEKQGNKWLVRTKDKEIVYDSKGDQISEKRIVDTGGAVVKTRAFSVGGGEKEAADKTPTLTINVGGDGRITVEDKDGVPSLTRAALERAQPKSVSLPSSSATKSPSGAIKLSDIGLEAISRTVYVEAGAKDKGPGMVAVAEVIKNRYEFYLATKDTQFGGRNGPGSVALHGCHFRGVCDNPRYFQADASGTKFSITLSGDRFERTKEKTQEVFSGSAKKVTNNALFFKTKDSRHWDSNNQDQIVGDNHYWSSINAYRMRDSTGDYLKVGGHYFYAPDCTHSRWKHIPKKYCFK